MFNRKANEEANGKQEVVGNLSSSAASTATNNNNEKYDATTEKYLQDDKKSQEEEEARTYGGDTALANAPWKFKVIALTTALMFPFGSHFSASALSAMKPKIIAVSRSNGGCKRK